jgi:hypothetical protein
MGRSFESVGQGMKSIDERRVRSSRALKSKTSSTVKKWWNLQKSIRANRCIGCDDPLEDVVFSVLLGMTNRQDEIKLRPGENGDH